MAGQPGTNLGRGRATSLPGRPRVSLGVSEDSVDHAACADGRLSFDVRDAEATASEVAALRASLRSVQLSARARDHGTHRQHGVTPEAGDDGAGGHPPPGTPPGQSGALSSVAETGATVPAMLGARLDALSGRSDSDSRGRDGYVAAAPVDLAAGCSDADIACPRGPLTAAHAFPSRFLQQERGATSCPWRSLEQPPAGHPAGPRPGGSALGGGGGAQVSRC